MTVENIHRNKLDIIRFLWYDKGVRKPLERGENDGFTRNADRL